MTTRSRITAKRSHIMTLRSRLTATSATQRGGQIPCFCAQDEIDTPCGRSTPLAKPLNLQGKSGAWESLLGELTGIPVFLRARESRLVRTRLRRQPAGPVNAATFQPMVSVWIDIRVCLRPKAKHRPISRVSARLPSRHRPPASI